MLAVACKQSREEKMFATSDGEETKITVRKLAFEAYPAWAADHADKQCPNTLGEMHEYTNDGPTADSWGKPLVMRCGANLPAGAKGFAVWSLGPDGVDGTADDIKSWE